MIFFAFIHHSIALAFFLLGITRVHVGLQYSPIHLSLPAAVTSTGLAMLKSCTQPSVLYIYNARLRTARRLPPSSSHTHNHKEMHFDAGSAPHLGRPSADPRQADPRQLAHAEGVDPR